MPQASARGRGLGWATVATWPGHGIAAFRPKTAQINSENSETGESVRDESGIRVWGVSEMGKVVLLMARNLFVVGDVQLRVALSCKFCSANRRRCPGWA